MMKTLLSATLFLALPAAAFAQESNDAVPDATVQKITEMLAGMECEMDPDDIEKSEEGGFELDDVYCSDGQYDIDLNANLEITNRRKE